MTGLEALEEIRKAYPNKYATYRDENGIEWFVSEQPECFNIIEKELKALEIIKQVVKSIYDSKFQTTCKLPNGKVIVTDLGYVEDFINKIYEEYDLLKEVFKNEN